MAHYRWIEPAPVPDTGNGMVGYSTGSPLLDAILLRRGIDDPVDARRFIHPSLHDLGDPRALPDLELALDRIRSAVRLRKGITIFGDYDVDGITSTALLARTLRLLGGQVNCYLPNRITEGYGLNPPAVRQIAADGAELLIAVDCGTSDGAELALAHELGLETVVIDHHHVHDHAHAPAETLPGTAFVSPRRHDCRYPFRDLAAVGVTYHVVRAVLGDEQAARFLPLVALGSVADVVPLRGENRVLVAEGLARFAADAPLGLRALAEVAGIDPAAVSSWHCGYVLGPRLNAAGRMDDPRLALRLLLTDDRSEANELANQLNHLNRQRQQTLNAILEQAEQQLQTKGEPPRLLMLGGEGWNVGVVGLVASRLTDRYHRPSVVLAHIDGVSRGSARSVEGFNIAEALDRCGDLLIEHGGHSLAAGLTVHPGRLVELESRLADLALEALGDEVARPELALDAELRFDDLSYTTVETIGQLEPFGQGNPAPRFLLRGARPQSPRPTRDGKHLQLEVADHRGRTVRAIYFDGTSARTELVRLGRVDLAFTLKDDSYNGRRRAQLEIIDYRPATR